MNHRRKFYTALLLFAFWTWLASAHSVLASPNAQIQNDSSYTDSSGYFHVVGEVLNTGDVWLRFVKVTGTLKDSNGQIVDVTFTYAYADYLPPAQRTPFNLIEIDLVKSAKSSSYSLTLDFQQATTAPANMLIIQGANSSKDGLGYFNIVGQVRNTGTQTSTFTKVVATYYNQAGKVIYVDFAFTSPSDIPPSQAYGFKIIGPGGPTGNQVASYNLFAQSQQYTSIPEWPWPTFVAGIVISLAVVAIRKTRPPGTSGFLFGSIRRIMN